MPQFRQIRKLKLDYTKDVTADLPSPLSILDVVAIPHSQNPKAQDPYLLYLFTGGCDTQEKTFRVILGEAEIHHEKNHMIYQGALPVKNETHPNFATVWIVTKEEAKVDEPKAKPDPNTDFGFKKGHKRNKKHPGVGKRKKTGQAAAREALEKGLV